MKHRTLLLAAALVASVSAFAQKNIVQYQETQARLRDVTTNVYMKPLTVELQVTNVTRQRVLVRIPVQRAFGAMKGDPNNWRSYAIYEASDKNHLNCDVIVAATFNVTYDNTVEENYVEVEVVGYPANFVNWQTATAADMEWIRMEKAMTTDDREKVGAAIAPSASGIGRAIGR